MSRTCSTAPRFPACHRARGTFWASLGRTLALLTCGLSVVSPAAAAGRCGDVIASIDRVGESWDYELPAVAASGNPDSWYAAMGRQVFMVAAADGTPPQPGIRFGVEVPGSTVKLAPAVDGLLYAAMDGTPTGAAKGCGLAVIEVEESGRLQLVNVVPLDLPIAYNGRCRSIGDLEVRPPLAFLSAGRDLLALDISDPWRPAEIGRATGGSYLHELDVEGPTAFVTTYQGVATFDISSPTAMSALDLLSLGDPVYDVAAFGSTILVGTGVASQAGSGELAIVDAADPRHLGVLGFLPLTSHAGEFEAVSLAADDDSLLVVLDSVSTSHLDLIAKVNVRDPRAPRLIATSWFHPSPPMGPIVRSGDVGLLAAYDWTLQMVDYRNPYDATMSAPIGIGDDISDIAVVEGHVVIGDRSSGLQVVDLANRTEPAITEIVNPGWWIAPRNPGVSNLAVAGPWIFTAAAEEGLNVTRLLADGSLDRHVRVPAIEATVDVAIEGSTLLVADASGRLIVYDASAPYQPEEIGSLDLPGTTTALHYAPPVAVVGAGTWDEPLLAVLDLSDPASPRLGSLIEVPRPVTDADTDGNLAAVALGYGGLAWFDVSDPAAPVELATLPSGPSAVGVVLERGVTWVVSENSANAVDVTDPTQPVPILWHMGFDGGRRIVLRGRYALVAAGADGGLLVDLGECLPAPSDPPRDLSGRIGP